MHQAAVHEEMSPTEAWERILKRPKVDIMFMLPKDDVAVHCPC